MDQSFLVQHAPPHRPFGFLSSLLVCGLQAMPRLGHSVNSEMLGCQQHGTHLGLVLQQQARMAKSVFGTLAAKGYAPSRIDRPCLGIAAPRTERSWRLNALK